jgi:hypothetical protein
MSVTSFWFGKAILNAFGGETEGESVGIDYLTNDIKVALFTSDAVLAQDTNEFFGDLSNECAATGNYSAGGATLASKTLGYTALTNVIKFGAANVTWSSSTISARYAVVYRDTGNSETSTLMGYVDFGQTFSSSNGDFTITWDAGGILTITAA